MKKWKDRRKNDFFTEKWKKCELNGEMGSNKYQNLQNNGNV